MKPVPKLDAIDDAVRAAIVAASRGSGKTNRTFVAGLRTLAGCTGVSTEEIRNIVSSDIQALRDQLLTLGEYGERLVGIVECLDLRIAELEKKLK